MGAEKIVVDTNVIISAMVGDEEVNILNAINSHAERIALSGASGLVPMNPDDDMIIDVALASGAKWIVTGDRHLLDGFVGTRILTSQRFLDELAAQDS